MGFVLSFFLLLFGVSVGVCYPIFICLFVVVLFCFLVSGYSAFLTSSFVGLCGSMDMFSTLLVVLSVWVVIMMYLVSLKYSYGSLFSSNFSLMVGILLLVVVVFFYADDLFLFYIMFEVSLLPTLYLVLKWGYQPERLQAGFYFIMYTVCGSLPLLFGIMYLQSSTFSSFIGSSYPVCFVGVGFNSYLFYLSLMFAFLVKVPMWGVHLWLPKAHVEAPVGGSMILAGILLKLGGYGLFKVFSMFTYCFLGGFSFILGVNLWGVVVVSLICLTTMDMKSMIAYSSVVHMGLMVVGILSGSVLGYFGAVLMMIAHGFSSPGLFSIVNFNYEGVGSRSLVMQKGVGLIYPVSSLLWFVLLCSNMAAPPSLNLVSELLVCVSILKLGGILFFVVLLSTFLSAGYNLYLFSCQQGVPTSFLNINSSMELSFILSSFMHIIPVYAMTFCVFCFYL